MAKKLSIVLIFLLFVTSCKSSRIIDLGSRITSKGITVAQTATGIFNLLAEQDSLEKYWLDIDQTLTNPSPSTMPLPNSHPKGFPKQIKPRIDAYKALIETYKVFNLLTDNKFSDENQKAIVSLRDSYNSIERLPDLPQEVSELLPEVSKIISQSVHAKKVKNHNEKLHRLTTLYLSLWEEDLKSWEERLNFMYSQQINRLNQLDNQKYDLVKISSFFKTPYKDEFSIILYRLNVRNDLIKQENEVLSKLDTFGKALLEINKAHGELAKNKVSLSEITTALNAIEKLIK